MRRTHMYIHSKGHRLSAVRWWTLAVILLLAVGLLIACGNGADASTDTGSSSGDTASVPGEDTQDRNPEQPTETWGGEGRVRCEQVLPWSLPVRPCMPGWGKAGM